jgi:hypothetical protein
MYRVVSQGSDTPYRPQQGPGPKEQQMSTTLDYSRTRTGINLYVNNTTIQVYGHIARHNALRLAVDTFKAEALKDIYRL